MLETLFTGLVLYLNRQTKRSKNNVVAKRRHHAHFSAYLHLVEKQYSQQLDSSPLRRSTWDYRAIP